MFGSLKCWRRETVWLAVREACNLQVCHFMMERRGSVSTEESGGNSAVVYHAWGVKCLVMQACNCAILHNLPDMHLRGMLCDFQWNPKTDLIVADLLITFLSEETIYILHPKRIFKLFIRILSSNADYLFRVRFTALCSGVQAFGYEICTSVIHVRWIHIFLNPHLYIYTGLHSYLRSEQHSV